MKTKKKRIYGKRMAVFAVLLATLSAAVYLNWQYTAKSGGLDLTAALDSTEKYLGDAKYVNAAEGTESTVQNDFFAKSRADREQAREESIATLKEIAQSAKSDEASKQSANEQIEALTQNAKKEADIETLIKAKGFADCVAVFTDTGINLIVKCEESGLAANETVQIQDVVLQNSEISVENIKIIEVK